MGDPFFINNMTDMNNISAATHGTQLPYTHQHAEHGSYPVLGQQNMAHPQFQMTETEDTKDILRDLTEEPVLEQNIHSVYPSSDPASSFITRNPVPMGNIIVDQSISFPPAISAIPTDNVLEQSQQTQLHIPPATASFNEPPPIPILANTNGPSFVAAAVPNSVSQIQNTSMPPALHTHTQTCITAKYNCVAIAAEQCEQISTATIEKYTQNSETQSVHGSTKCQSGYT